MAKEVWVIRDDGEELLLNDEADMSATYACAIDGLIDLPQREAIWSSGYASGAVLVDSRDVPRTFTLLLTILAGLDEPETRNPTFIAARDAFLRMFPQGEEVTIRSSYPGTAGYWDIRAMPQGGPWKKGTTQYEIAMVSGGPVLVSTIVQSHIEHLPDGLSDETTFILSVGGNVPTYPVIVIHPTQGKTDRWNIMREYLVTNNKNVDLVGEPVALPFDFAWHISNGRIRANGEDIRVLANDQMIDRWWSTPIGTATKIWVHLDIPALDTVTVQVVYQNGDAGAGAWVNATDGPIFDKVNSTNSTRRFAGAFMDPPGAPTTHSSQWNAHSPGRGLAPLQRHLGSPWQQDTGYPTAVNIAGGEIPAALQIEGYAGLAFHHPLGIASVSHAGHTQLTPTRVKLVLRGRTFDGFTEDLWALTDDTSAALAAYPVGGGSVITPVGDREAVVFALRSGSVHNEPAGGPIGAADRVTLTLTTPVTVSGNDGTGSDDEVGVYMLEATIRNNTTGEEITLFGLITRVGLVYNSAIYNGVDQLVTMAGENFYYALSLTPPIRRDWLRLVPGDNEIYVRDEAVDGLDITVSWQDRRV